LSDNNRPAAQGNTEDFGTSTACSWRSKAARARPGRHLPTTVRRRFLRWCAAARFRAPWSTRGQDRGGAETKGEFRTVQFNGTTGLQGPYPLLSQARTTSDVIIAGTERVSIDGIRVERGPNRDYLIDYDAGTVLFTPRRLITTDTEIAVDFSK
jgi:hypothetical protein